MNQTLDQVMFRVLGRLDDSDGDVWSRDEIRLYIKDGANLFCRRSRCLFDMAYIENLPAVGNYSSSEEYELAKQIPGLILTNRREFTRSIDKYTALPGLVGPAGLSTHAQIPLLEAFEEAGLEVAKSNPTGQLPRGFVAIERVTHDGITLYPEFSSGLAHEVDNRYEHQEGDSDWFTLDKDGLFTLRRYPTGDGEADYGDVTGFYGVEVSDDDYTGVVIGDWGALAYDPENFPMGGPWGAPARLHPDTNNTRVELSRLNLDLDGHVFDIPDSYIKYVEFWACSRALRRDGPGQDIKLADHYAERFELGIDRMLKRRRNVESEHIGRIGHGEQRRGIPLKINLPYNYGTRIRRGGGY